MSTGDKRALLAGKVALVTGSTTGLGLRVYRELARLGAKVYVAGRNEEAGRKAADEFPDAVYVKMDLSTIKSSHEAAQAFLALNPERLDILVENAAILNGPEYAVNSDGIVTHMAVNHFGHFVLTNELLPLLEKTSELPGADVRVIVVGSGAINTVSKPRRFSSLEDINADLEGEGLMAKMNRYGASKLTQVLWARELHRRLRDNNTKITVITVDPGAASSEGNLAGLHNFALPYRLLLRAVTRSPEEAALTIVWAVAIAEPAKFNGKTIARSMFSRSYGEQAWSGPLVDGKWEPLGKQLWETSERVAAEKL